MLPLPRAMPMLWDTLQSVVKLRAKAYPNVEKRYEGGGGSLLLKRQTRPVVLGLL